MIENYKKFIGKICTILTHPTAFPLSDSRQGNQFFTGLVTEVNKWGVWLKHPNAPFMAYFQFPLVGIAEEPFIPEGSPEHKKIKEELEAKKKPAPIINSGSFTSVAELSEKVRSLKSIT